jgi:hypothetical protein
MIKRIWPRVVFCLLLLFWAPAGFALPTDPPAPSPSTDSQLPFGPNEELVYNGEFSRLLLRGVDIADLIFRVTVPADRNPGNGQPEIYRIKTEVLSKGIVTKIFGLKFHQLVDSTVALEPFATQLTTKLDEQGKRVRMSESVFDPVDGKVTYTERDPNEPNKPPRIVATPLAGTAQDIASVFYYLRTQKLEPGTTVTVQISDSGQVYTVPIKISQGKKLKTVLGKVSTVRVEPDLFGDGKLIHSKGSLIIYMTSDSRHIPVQAQIKAEIGTIDIKLKRATLSKSN